MQGEIEQAPVVEAVQRIVRTGSPWRDLPAEIGEWNTFFKRFRDQVKADVFHRPFDTLSDELDMKYAMADATIVKTHLYSKGAKKLINDIGFEHCRPTRRSIPTG